MDEQKFAVNQIIHDGSEDKDYRILWIPSEEQEPCFWIEASGRSNIPTGFFLSDLRDGFEKGRFSLAPDIYSAMNGFTEPNDTARQYRDKNWDLIREIVTSEPDVFDMHKRKTLMQATEARTGVSITNLYKFLGRYWRGGKVPDTLLPYFSVCGHQRDVYKKSSKKPGRKKKTGADGKKLTQKDLQNFQDAVNRHYLTADKPSFQQTYDLLCQDHYMVKDSAGRHVDNLPEDEVPSFQQFYYWYRHHRDPAAAVVKRNGQNAYELTSRGRKDRTENSLFGPGECVQIDATLADVFLVSRANRSKIIGRPVIYFLTDSFSRIIMGMWISLDAPSWLNATKAILNAVEDKVSYCRRHGVEITEEQWPCRNLPSVLLGDRGEMESRAADVIVNRLGITIENTPPYRGDLKGIVECKFKMINLDLYNLPGKIEKDYGERCSPDYRFDAIMDIEQFTQYIINCVVTYNTSHYMEEYRKTPRMRQTGVAPVPVQLWNYGIRYLSGGMKTVDYETLRYAVLPRGEATITREGIHFNGMFYSCDLAESENWYGQVRAGNAWKVSAAYDPTDAAVIFICPNAKEKPVECHLTDKDWIYDEMTQEEIQQMKDEDLTEKQQYARIERLAKAKRDDANRAIVRDAKRMMPKNIKESKAERIAEIQKNREEEKARLKEEETAKTLQERGYAAIKTESAEPEPPTALPVSPIALLTEQLLGGDNDEEHHS